MSVETMVFEYSPDEVECSLFQVLMLSCDTWLLDPETLAFEGTANAVKSQSRTSWLQYIQCRDVKDGCRRGRQHTSASAPLYGVSVNVFVKILICSAQNRNMSR